MPGGTLRMEGTGKSEGAYDGGSTGHQTRWRMAQILRDMTGKVEPGVKSGPQQAPQESQIG